VILPAAAVAGFAAWKLRKIANRRRRRPPAAEPVDLSKIGWDEVTDNMQVMLDIGYGLVPLVDERRGGPLMGRITGVRRQLSKELGFVVPQVRVRDDINLAPFTYRIVSAAWSSARTASRPTRCSRSIPARHRPAARQEGQGSDLRARRGVDPFERCRCRDRHRAISSSIRAPWSRRISTRR
jgi:hypothetical protein